jgi:hypothetical protein
VGLLRPWERTGRAVALDSTALRAKGGVWHKKDKEAGVVPHTSIDTEAAWTKSGWHGWVYGWKLHLAITVAGMWIPLSARLTPAEEADNQIAPSLIEELPEEARFVLGDTHYDAENVREKCEQTKRFLVTSKRGAYPHTDCVVCGGEADLFTIHAAQHGQRELQRALQEHLRCTRAGSHEGQGQHRALRSWGGVRLPVGSAPPS